MLQGFEVYYTYFMYMIQLSSKSHVFNVYHTPLHVVCPHTYTSMYFIHTHTHNTIYSSRFDNLNFRAKKRKKGLTQFVKHLNMHTALHKCPAFDNWHVCTKKIKMHTGLAEFVDHSWVAPPPKGISWKGVCMCTIFLLSQHDFIVFVSSPRPNIFLKWSKHFFFPLYDNFFFILCIKKLRLKQNKRSMLRKAGQMHSGGGFWATYVYICLYI